MKSVAGIAVPCDSVASSTSTRPSKSHVVPRRVSVSQSVHADRNMENSELVDSSGVASILRMRRHHSTQSYISSFLEANAPSGNDSKRKMVLEPNFNGSWSCSTPSSFPEDAKKPFDNKRQRVYDHRANKMISSFDSCPKAQYKYALNTAIQQQADSSKLQRLIKAAPAALENPEETGEYSLHVLLRHKPSDSDAAAAMLYANKSIVELVDAKGNTPLHTLVSYATKKTAKESREVAQLLLFVCPGAPHRINNQGETPLELARRSNCPNDVVSLLKRYSLQP